jgi:hypothetical protein
VAESLVLEFRAAGHLLGTPAQAGLRLRTIEQVWLAADDALPLRGLVELTPLVPLIDLAYLLTGAPTGAGVALEAATPDGLFAFHVEAALDIRAVADASLRHLPRLLEAWLPRPRVWSVALVDDGVLPVVSLDRLLADEERRELRVQAAALARDAVERGR